MPKFGPHAGGALATLVRTRIAELAPRKTQTEIAREVGYTNVNVLSMIKHGNTKLPLDRVAGLARALELDPRHLFNLAVAQEGHETLAQEIREIFNTTATRNEAEWVEAIREASGGTDPSITKRARAAVLAIFGR